MGPAHGEINFSPRDMTGERQNFRPTFSLNSSKGNS